MSYTAINGLNNILFIRINLKKGNRIIFLVKLLRWKREFKIMSGIKNILLGIIILYLIAYTCSFGQEKYDKTTIKGGKGLDLLNGVWEGKIDNDKITMVIKLMDGSKVYGYSIVYLNNNTSTEIFTGLAENDGNIILNEPKEGSFNGVYSFKIVNEKLTGEWKRNKDGGTKNCTLSKTKDLTVPKIKPVEFIDLVLTNITNFASKRDERYLNNVYNSWHIPEKSIGKSFKNFIKDFTRTVSDSLVSSEPSENYTVFAIIKIVHDATDLNDQLNKLITTRYEAEYKLINVNGFWKILHADSKKDGVVRTAFISQDNYSAQFKTVNPNAANVGQTVNIFLYSNFDSLSAMNLQVLIGDKNAEVLERRWDTAIVVISAVVPELDTGKANIIVKFNDKSLDTLNEFRIISTEGASGFRWYYYVILIVVVVIIFIAAYRNYRLSKEKDSLSLKTTQLDEEKQKLSEANKELLHNISQKNSTGTDVNISLPQPNVPQELIDACKKRECVLYTGSEIAVQAGFPDWQQFVEDLLNWSVENKHIEDESLINSFKSSLKSGNVNRTADSIIFTLEKLEVNLNDYLNKLFIQQKPEIPGIYRVIKSTNFSAILSTTFDQTIERTYDNQLDVYTCKDIERLQESVSNNTLFLLKIYGDVTNPGTVLVSPSRFDNEMLRNLQFSQFIETLFYSRSVFFIGEDIEGIESFFNSVKFRGFRSRPHFALVGVKTAGWKTSAQVMEEKFGIKVIPYEYGNTEQLAKFISDLSFSAPNTSETDKKEKKYSIIKKISLKNIGPFENLEITFDKNWNILLGDNGVGKSTILKAVATVICGHDSTAYAYRLIKSGQNEGTIILETEEIFENNTGTETFTGSGKAYIAKIFKTGRDKAEIERYVRPLDSENWLVLAFPPLRTVTWNRPAGPQPDGSKISVSEDILPILAGETDPRMDKLKQWVVNQYFKSTDNNKSEEERNIYKKQLDKFTQVIDDLTPNLIVKDLEINTDTFEITIRTEDGKIPIESISQGTLSLISWVGILMQRLYEVFGEDDEPLLQHAKVIMDEVDAHMHPQWQQTLVYNLKSVFPNIQFIVSTHSPFVVGGMKPEQVLKFGRNDQGKIIKTEALPEDLHGRIDQIITSPLFGLDYSRDYETKTMLLRYSILTTKIELTPAEEEELGKLAKKLNKNLLLPHEKKEARNAFELIQESLKEKLKSLDVTQRNKILKEMEIQVQDSITKTKK